MQEVITDAQTGEVTTRDLTAEEIAALTPSKATWRATASASRAAFCIAIARAGIVTPANALAAAKGDWPAEFDEALTGMSAEAQTDARITWAAAATIERLHPLVHVMQDFLTLTDDQADALFA